MAAPINRGFTYTESAVFYAPAQPELQDMSGITVEYCIKTGRIEFEFEATVDEEAATAAVSLTPAQTSVIPKGRPVTTYWKLSFGSVIEKRGEISRKVV